MLRWSSFTLAGLLALGCTPSMEIDAPEVDVTQPDLQFFGIPAGVSSGGSVMGYFKFSAAKLGATTPDAGTLKNVKRLQVTRVVLLAKTGIEDFSFLDHLTVDAANLGYATQSSPGQPVIRIVDYQASPGVPTGPKLEMPLSPPVDMLPLWVHTWLYLTVTATGYPPSIDWSVDVEFSLSVKITE